MGVDIGPIIEREAVSLDHFKGKKIAIDAYNTIYQFLTIIRQPDGTPLQDSSGNITSHLSGLFYRNCNLLERGIRPIYVFDGTPSELKKETLAKREEAKKLAQQQMEEAIKEGRTELAAMLSQRTVRLNAVMVGQCKELLELMGIPYIQAPSEGEAQCARMCADGMVYAAASQDYDSILFGAPVLARNITISGRRKIPSRQMFTEINPEIIELTKVLEKLNINRQKLIWLAMLIGTDFNKGVYGIGPKKGLKLVLECENLTEISNKLKEPQEFLNVQPVEDLFMNPPSRKVEESEIRFQRAKVDKIIDLLCVKCGFSQARVESSMAKAYEQSMDTSQNSLTKWF